MERVHKQLSFTSHTSYATASLFSCQHGSDQGKNKASEQSGFIRNHSFPGYSGRSRSIRSKKIPSRAFPSLLGAFDQEPEDAAAAHTSFLPCRSGLAAGADPNASDDTGETPLYHAVDRGDLAAVTVLFECGGRPKSLFRRNFPAPCGTGKRPGCRCRTSERRSRSKCGGLGIRMDPSTGSGS